MMGVHKSDTSRFHLGWKYTEMSRVPEAYQQKLSNKKKDYHILHCYRGGGGKQNLSGTNYPWFSKLGSSSSSNAS